MHRPRLAASKITGVNRKNPSSMTQIIRNPSIWSTYINSHQRVTNVSPVICLTDRPFVRPEVTPNIGKFACATSCRLPWWRATWPPEGFSNDISVQNLRWLSTFLGDYTHHFFGGMIRISLRESWWTNQWNDRVINWTPALTNSWCKPTCELRSEQTLSA